MGRNVIVLIAEIVLEVLFSEWNQILIQNVSVQHPSYILVKGDQVRSTTMMKCSPNMDGASSTCLIEHYIIIGQCFFTQPPHPNSAIDAIEQETRLIAKHNMTPVMDSEATVLSGKCRRSPLWQAVSLGLLTSLLVRQPLPRKLRLMVTLLTGLSKSFCHSPLSDDADIRRPSRTVPKSRRSWRA